MGRRAVLMAAMAGVAMAVLEVILWRWRLVAWVVLALLSRQLVVCVRVGVLSRFVAAGRLLLVIDLTLAGLRGRLGRGDRCGRGLHVRAFGHVDAAFLRIRQFFGIVTVSIHGDVPDGACFTLAAVPDQTVELVGVNDLAFNHGVAVQCQRDLVVIVFDDEAVEFLSGLMLWYYFEVGGLVTFKGEGVVLAGVGIRQLDLVVADPGRARTVFTFRQPGLQVLLQPRQFVQIIDFQQLATQSGGFCPGFGKRQWFVAGDHFVAGELDGLFAAGGGLAVFCVDFGVHGPALVVCVPCLCVHRFGLDDAGQTGQRGMDATQTLGVMVGASSGSLVAAVVVAPAHDPGVRMFGVMRRFDVGDLDVLDFTVIACGLGRFEGRLCVGQTGLAVHGHFRGVGRTLGDGGATCPGLRGRGVTAGLGFGGRGATRVARLLAVVVGAGFVGIDPGLAVSGGLRVRVRLFAGFLLGQLVVARLGLGAGGRGAAAATAATCGGAHGSHAQHAQADGHGADGGGRAGGSTRTGGARGTHAGSRSGIGTCGGTNDACGGFTTGSGHRAFGRGNEQRAVGGLGGGGVGQLFGVGLFGGGLFGGGGLLQLPLGRGAFVQQVQGVVLGLGVAHGGRVGGCVRVACHVGLLCHVRVSRCDGPRYPSCS